MPTSIRSLSRMLTAILLTMALAFSGSVALADDDDDDVNSEPTAYLYEGTIDNIDAATVVDEIDDLDEEDDDDDNDWNKLGDGQDRPEGLLATQDDIDDDLNLTVQSLVDGDYMIVVHADDNTDSPILAAGAIEGEIVDGAVLIQLSEIDASGHEGRAFIEPDEDDDDDNENEIEITVGIFPVGSVEPLVAPTPAG